VRDHRVLFWWHEITARLLSRLHGVAARLGVQYPNRSPSRSSYIWDREIDGPEELVEIVERARRSGREYLNLLLRAALWALLALVFAAIYGVGTEPGLGALYWRGFLGLALCWALHAIDPHARDAGLTFFRVFRRDPPGGGPQRPTGA
jgi:hypothetical protein